MGIGVGQHASNALANGNTSVTTPARTTAASGSTFVLYAMWYGGAFSSILDSKGNSYVPIGTQIDSYSNFWYCENGTGGSGHTATLNITGTGAPTLFFLEITGGLTSGILDQHAEASSGSLPVLSGLTPTTTQANELLVGVGVIDSTGAYSINGATPSSGWTIQEEVDDSATFNAGAIATVIVSSTGQYQAGFSAVGGTSGRAYVATFKDASAGGGPTINTQPSDVVTWTGLTANFTVSATASGGSLTYQWQVSTDRGVTFNNVSSGSGGTTSSYTTAALVFSDDQTFYQCIVTDSNGNVTTRAASLRVGGAGAYAWTKA